MEVEPKRPCGAKEDEKVSISEKKIGGGGSFNSSSPNRKDYNSINQVSTVIARERSSMETYSKQISPLPLKGSITANQDDQLESTKAEMGEVREENERLKTLLAKVVKDYQSLKMHFFDIVQQDQPTKPEEDSHKHVDEERDQLVSLSLGTKSTSGHKKEEKKSKDSTNNDQIREEGLTLGLDCKFEGSSSTNNISPSNSVEESKEEELGEPWPPTKILKNIPSVPDVDEVSQQTHVKRTRVSVRARCDAPTMHDGCQWRKYGQKIAKGNPCPRAYYRCTVAPQCPVRKQVQRCAEDMSILITTYEGTHNHPLPISATAMASTTSAAACMLTSGSTASSSSISTSVPNLNSSSIGSNALNFNLSNFNSQSRPFYLPNPTISSTPSYPTITLDLTSPPQTASQTSQFNRMFTSRYSTSFNFSSSESIPALPITSWPNGSYLNYNKIPIGSFGSLADQSHLQKATNIPLIGASTATQNVLTDTIAKAITSDPSFQSALATAITSYVGGPNGSVQNGNLMFMQSPLSFTSSKSASASPVDNRENIN